VVDEAQCLFVASEESGMSFNWNRRAADAIATEAMQDLARQGRQRLRNVTCPVHGSTHAVKWESRGKNINVSVADGCCDELEAVLHREAERAIK
jgi:hypothetical protein